MHRKNGRAQPVTIGDVELADAIETVRRELEEAMKRGSAASMAFEAGSVEMEFEVAFTAATEIKAGVRVWVVNVGAGGDLTRSSTNRLKIVLQPVDRVTRKKSLIGDVGTS
jgi:hypothetical protein